MTNRSLVELFNEPMDDEAEHALRFLKARKILREAAITDGTDLSLNAMVRAQAAYLGGVELGASPFPPAPSLSKAPVARASDEGDWTEKAASAAVHSTDPWDWARSFRLSRKFQAVVSVAAVGLAVFCFWGTRQESTPPGFGTTTLGDIDYSTPIGSLFELETVAFKGTPGMSVIRDRHGAQVMFQDEGVVIPGDRIRLRFGIQSAGPMLGGILVDDGEWIALFEEEFEAGMHSPAATLKFDKKPVGGVVLLGSPEAVAAVRAGKRRTEVQQVRVLWRSKPTKNTRRHQEETFAE